MPETKPAEVPWLKWARKAAIAGFAGVVGVLGVLVVAVTVGSDGGASITTSEWLQAAIVAVTAIGGSLGVYTARNQTTAPAARVVVPRDEAGQSNYIGLVVMVLLILILVAVLLRVL